MDIDPTIWNRGAPSDPIVDRPASRLAASL